MKLSVCSVLSPLFIAGTFAVTIPVMSGPPNRTESQSEKARVKVGPEVAARVKRLKDNNQNVRAAFRAFERKGRKPKIEDAWMITSKLSPEETSLIRIHKNRDGAVMQRTRALMPQQTVYGAQGEVTFIPTVSLDGEWQGTIITTAYDEYGNFIKQYTADVVLVRDAAVQDWIAVYEVGFEGGVPYLNWEPGMYTGFELGTPLGNQAPPPTQLLQWQEYDPSFDPANGTFEGGGHGPMMEQQISRLSRINFTANHFSKLQAGDRGGDYRYRNGRCPCDPPPAIRSWAGCTVAGCSGAAASCVLAGPFTAACFGSRCAGVGVACAVRALLGG